MSKQIAKVDDPQAGQIWFVRYPDNHWELARVVKIIGALADVIYGDGTKERFNIKRYADAIVLADPKVKFSAKEYTSAQVTKLAAHAVEDDDPEWMHAQVVADPADQLKYVRKMWREYNTTLFHGKLNPVAFKMMPVKSVVKTLGLYTFGGSRTINLISMSPNVFMAGKDAFRNTLVHEMCHQYVVENLKLPKDGHGPAWQRTMRSVGLSPDRLSKTDHDLLADDNKVEERQQVREMHKKAVSDFGEMRYPREGIIVGWASQQSGKLEKGVLVCPYVQNGSSWAVANDAYSETFKIIQVANMLKTEYGERRWQDIGAFSNFGRIIDKIKDHLQRKQQVKAIKRQIKQTYGRY